jgi:hypothetical protein
MASPVKAKAGRSGQAIVMVTGSLLFLFAVMGLSIDLGWAYFLKTRVQTAADAAAISAAVYALNHGESCATVTCGTVYNCAGVTPPTTSLQAGCLYATQDGPPSMTATMIENNTTPPGVSGNNPSLWIKATVSTTAPNLFLFGSGYTTASIAAQAISGVTTLPPTSCVYVLSPNAASALQVTGTSNLTTSGCGVYVNSSSSTALVVSGSSSITATTIQVVGGSSIAGSSTTHPAVTTGAGSVTDPLASLPAPTFSGCDQTNYSIGNGKTATLNPGVYCGGISIGGAANVTLNPGNYILNGNGLTVSNGATMNASHVMFYNTATSGNTPKPISITGSAVVNLTAPNSGTYQGIAFYQDRTLTYSTANTIANSGTGNITGTYYFPTTAFNFTGNTSTPVYAAFVAKTIAITGSSSLKNDTTGTYTGLTSSKATLIQ